MAHTNALHLILSNADGEPLDYEKAQLEPTDYRRYLQSMFENIKAQAPENDQGKKQILIHIHGGLNRLDSSINRAKKLVPRVLKGEYYPILFGWQSGPLFSYYEHLFVVRQGRKRIWVARFTSPFVLAADLGRGLTRAPLVVWRQFAMAARTVNSKWVNDARNARALYCALDRKRRDENSSTDSQVTNSSMECRSIVASMGGDRRRRLRRFFRAVTYIILLFSMIKPFFAVFIDGLGKAGWENMLRRTKVVFRTPSEFDIKALRDSPQLVDEAACSPAAGAVSGLFRELTDFIKVEEKANSSRYEITLVGHSMGVIIMNEVIRQYPDLPYKRIIYMGAACSIREFAESVIPYLKANEESQFYNLCLHPIAEAREIAYRFLDIFPRGSLLEWIDNLFSSPHTLMDRRLGKWDNIMQVTHIIPEEVRGRVTIKAFGVGKDLGKPQRHGDFNDIDFWDDRILNSAD